MFVRVKRVGSKRYVYLAEGIRQGVRVRQRILCYLGPLWKLGRGVPDDVQRRAEQRVPIVDWNRVNAEIRRVPLTFEEISDVKRAQYTLVVRARRGFRNRSEGNMPRAKGELVVLSKLAAARFREMFQTVGDRVYRMR